MCCKLRRLFVFYKQHAGLAFPRLPQSSSGYASHRSSLSMAHLIRSSVAEYFFAILERIWVESVQPEALFLLDESLICPNTIPKSQKYTEDSSNTLCLFMKLCTSHCYNSFIYCTKLAINGVSVGCEKLNRQYLVLQTNH